MTDEQRIEAAARKCTEFETGVLHPDVVDEVWRLRRAKVCEIIAAAYPELHSDKPSHWLAPWEASEVMYAAAEETNRGGGIADGGGGEPDIYDLEEVWSAMRTAHLAKED